jgi:hypothetical protein
MDGKERNESRMKRYSIVWLREGDRQFHFQEFDILPSLAADTIFASAFDSETKDRWVWNKGAWSMVPPVIANYESHDTTT